MSNINVDYISYRWFIFVSQRTHTQHTRMHKKTNAHKNENNRCSVDRHGIASYNAPKANQLTIIITQYTHACLEVKNPTKPKEETVILYIGKLMKETRLIANLAVV